MKRTSSMLVHSFAGSNIIKEISDRVLAMSNDVVWGVIMALITFSPSGRAEYGLGSSV